MVIQDLPLAPSPSRLKTLGGFVEHRSPTHTLHGTGIYAAPLTPKTTPTDRQSYGSPMGRVWVLLEVIIHMPLVKLR